MIEKYTALLRTAQAVTTLLTWNVCRENLGQLVVLGMWACGQASQQQEVNCLKIDKNSHTESALSYIKIRNFSQTWP